MGLRDKFKKIVEGGPEHQARKAEKKRLNLQLKQERDQAYFEGRRKGEIAGAKAKGFREGKAKASGGGGLSGAMAGIGAGMKSLEKGGNAMFGDMNFEGIGSGLAFDGFGGGSPRKKRSKSTRKRTARKRRK